VTKNNSIPIRHILMEFSVVASMPL
jgi:hypothetical protein